MVMKSNDLNSPCSLKRILNHNGHALVNKKGSYRLWRERERTTTRVKLRSRSILIIIPEKCLDFRVEYVNSQL